jgi:hypothetical protein
MLALLVAGCGAATTSSPGGASPATTRPTPALGSYPDRNLPPLILSDPAPGMLDISLSIQIDGESDAAHPVTAVGLAFLSGDRTVQFAGTERVTCDGTDLPIKNREAVFQLLQAPAAQAAGTTITCAYAAGGVTASFALQVPAPPAITSPGMGALVARGPRTLVTYRADLTSGTVLGIVALAPGSPSPKVLARLDTPDPLQATVDTHDFDPGPGTLTLSVSLAPQVSATGARFKSVMAFGMATAQVAVTWG